MRGLYAFKPWYTRRLSAIVDGAVTRGLSPDAFTWAGTVAALVGGAAVAYGLWPLALVLVAARLAGANLDGAVARARGVSRPWGFVLNEIGDRASDLLLMAGVVVLAGRTDGWSAPSVTWALVAALAATLPTFVSLSAAGAGAPRTNGGPFGKTERCLAVVVAAALPGWLVPICVVVVAGSVLTAVLRAVAARRALAAAPTTVGGES